MSAFGLREHRLIERRNVIPPITHPMGQHWRQPSLAGVLIDDTHALMDQATFAALAEYSGTTPTGVYEGKAWKRQDGVFDHLYRQHMNPAAGWQKPRDPKDCPWMLCWYGPSDEPNSCSVNARTILFV